MQNINKKGFSAITAIVLILVAIAALILVFSYVKSTIKPNLSPEFSCFELQLKNPLSIEDACYNLETEDIEVTIKRSLEDIPINELLFRISSDTNSTLWKCSDSCNNCKILKSGELKKYYFSAPADSNVISLSLGSCPIVSSDVSPLCEKPL